MQISTLTLNKPPEQTAKEKFLNTPRPIRITRKPKKLSEETEQYLKIFAYGNTGTGKTLLLAGLLERGLTVLAVSTDFGGEGFSSVRRYLRDIGKKELLDNCFFFDLDSYDDVEDLLQNPESFWPEIYEHDIDVLFWDGFSGFQQCLLDYKVLHFAPSSSNATDARKNNLFADQQDWGAIKRGTSTPVDSFLRLKNKRTGKPWNKIMTAHCDNKPKEDKVSGEVRIGPLLQGAGASVIEPAFDLIFRTRKKSISKDGKKVVEYFYEMEGTDSKILTKARGLKFEPTEPADFKALWESACKQKGLPSGKLL